MGLVGALAAVLVGGIVGDGVAALAARLALGRPILRPPVCERTGRRVAAADALPLLGYLRQRGRCRQCRLPLPRWWPLTEAGMALLALLAYMSAGGWTPRFALYLFDLAVLLAILVMDWRRHEIYTLVLLAGAAGGLVGGGLLGEFSIGTSLEGGLWGGGLMLALYGFGRLWGRLHDGRAGLAWGDVELAAMLGLMTGFPGVITPLFWGPVIGIILFLRRGWSRYFPFAPGLCLVAMAFMLTHTSPAPLWETLRLPLLGQILLLAGQAAWGGLQMLWGRFIP